MVKKITSFWPSDCEWCKEIREKYKIRQQIVQKLELQPFADYLSTYATCPFHKTTVYFGSKKYQILINDEINQVIAEWWTIKYEYKLTFDLEASKVGWTTNHKPSHDIPLELFDFGSLLKELLMLMNKEQLEKVLEILNNIKTDSVLYIVQRFQERGKKLDGTIELQDKKVEYTEVLELECKDKPITSKVQGFFEHEGQKYYKMGKFVYKLRG
ncbi:hypothetical protein DRP07_02225 [Archaeoglobales archaeon]|nr:MAG: hypothetical protein DRP07_02225 [Archaeoglobales archaeon]